MIECDFARPIAESSSEERRKAWQKVARWWGSGLNRLPMEIDVLAESIDGKTLLAGEMKLSLTKREAEHAQAELDAKVRQLPFAKDYKKVVTRLFVAKKGSFDAISLSWLDSQGRGSCAGLPRMT